MNGKAIYMPKGAAGEYSKYACNFYRGCSNGCSYCYLKRGVLKHACSGDKPVLKSCFKSEEDAIRTYHNELLSMLAGKNGEDIKKHGIFFSFTSDPCLPETIALNFGAISRAMKYGVPVQILTKCTEWVYTDFGAGLQYDLNARKYLSVGFTLTGRDDLEPNAAPNMERIKAMRLIHGMGIRTWASVEPVIEIASSKRCIADTLGYCDEYKIGLLSGRKPDYSKEDVREFVEWGEKVLHGVVKIYWKESVQKFVND